jgi:hypothetical protein
VRYLLLDHFALRFFYFYFCPSSSIRPTVYFVVLLILDVMMHVRTIFFIHLAQLLHKSMDVLYFILISFHLKKIGKKILDADEGDTIISKFLKTSPRMLRTIFQATRRHTYKLVDHKHVSSFILAIHKHGVQSCSRFDRPVIRH